MSDELALVSRRLEEEGGKMLAFFEELSDGDWEQQVYVTGSGWRIRDLLAHFVSAEHPRADPAGESRGADPHPSDRGGPDRPIQRHRTPVPESGSGVPGSRDGAVRVDAPPERGRRIEVFM